jgi:solute carrier family 25 (mitochondrial phosphate transporter), member 3
LDATIQICKTDGPATLLQGLGPTVVGYGVEGAMKFGVYEVCKPIFLKIFPNHKGMAFVLSSFLAGAVAAVLLVPMESLRIKQVTDPNFQHESLWTGIPKLIRQDGLLSIMMSGTLAMLAKQVPYTFGKQVSFDVIAATLYQVLAQVMQVVNKWLVSILSAFCASIVACLCSQPGDMILTETYKGTTGSGTGRTNTKPEAFATVVQNMYRRGGPAEFFRGTGARIVHVGMIITSQLVVYDLVKQLLGLPATGSH